MGARYLGDTAIELIIGAFTKGTAKKYRALWRRYVQFLIDFDMCYGEMDLCHYIEYLYVSGLKHNTIQGHLSAISLGLKLRKLPDVTKTFMVSLMLRGAKRFTYSKDTRRPISESMVKQLIDALALATKDPFLYILYATVFAWAFYGCLRISEYTQGPVADHNIHIEGLSRVWVLGETAFRIQFRSFKHSPYMFPDFVMRRTGDSRFCPVVLMNRYLQIRPKTAGPLFVTDSGPLTRGAVYSMMERCVALLQWPKKTYEPHSFRIDRATMWALQGYSAVQIKAMGRWHSEAFWAYIRPVVILAN